MSCQLGIQCTIKDVSALKRFLFPSTASAQSDSHSESNSDTDGWDSDWGWGDADQDSQVQDSVNDSWLHDCEVSVSSLGDLIVIAHADRLALLQLNYEDGGEEAFIVLWKRILSEFPKECVTSVYCLPLISHKRSSQGSPEWTCIIVGFNTGHVRMYSETGTKVLDQMIHNESVIAIKCKTYSPPRFPGSSDLREELSILYETVIVTLDGFGLFQTLRACKNRAAMAAASGSEELELPSLGYKKWGLRDQGQANDHISAGTYTPNPFDQMHTASVAGFNEKISVVPPTSHVYACAGENPYVGIYHAMDGQSYRLLTDVTGMATQLLSAGASKLLSWGSSFLRKQEPAKEEKKQVKIEPATPVFRRYTVQDKRRVGHSMLLSPCGNVAAVTDSLGRVLLVDVNRGVVRRIWKGYRNAQVGWMNVKEKPTGRNSIRRHAFFLLIYAPKRGLLEIWLADSGPRVGAFNVGKGCRLIYPGASLLGINSSTYGFVKGKICQCYLLNANGELMDINIPFHLALSDANSKRAHDHHLLLLVRAKLKETDINSEAKIEELWDPICKLKLTLSFTFVIQRLLSADHISHETALYVIDKIMELVKSRSEQAAPSEKSGEGEDKAMDIESRLLLESCTSREILINIHSQLTADKNVEPGDKEVDMSSVLPADEVSSLLLLDVHSSPSKKVSFTSDSQLSLSAFLALFEGQHCSLRQHQLTNEQLVGLGELVYGPYLMSAVTFGEVRDLLSPLDFSPRFFLDCLLQYYLSLPYPSDSSLPSLESAINLLYLSECEEGAPPQAPTQPPTTPGVDDLTPGVQYDQPTAPFPQAYIAPWWTYIRGVCENSSNLRSYLHIAVVCRSICIKQCKELTNEFSDVSEEFEKVPGADDSKNSSWEHVSKDQAMWSVSLKHLDDIIALNSLLLYQHCSPSKTGLDTVTVAQLKTGNRGLVGELVGRWCVSNKLTPSDLTPAKELSSPEQLHGHMRLYTKVKDTFPYSLRSDTIYANACWEYMCQWNKEVESLFNFKFALQYLGRIENGCLRHGICVMMWTTYIMKRVSGLVLLLEKVGKAPKDRLCKKDLDMDTATTTEFMGVVFDYMEIFLQANCDYGEPVIYKQEDIWSEETTGHSLVQMACQQKETNYRMVKHHSLLITIVNAVLAFGMKSVKLWNLFEHNGKIAFFKDLHSHPYLPVEGKDEEVNYFRIDFLSRVLVCAVESLPHRDLLVGKEGLIRVDKDSDAMRWPQIVIDLAESIELDADHLRKVYIHNLVLHGHDKLALEMLPLMREATAARAVMLEVCAERFSHYMFEANQEKVTEITSSASPVLLTWLNEMAPSQVHLATLANLEVPLKDTNELLLELYRGLESSHRYYRHAKELYELTSNLK